MLLTIIAGICIAVAHMLSGESVMVLLRRHAGWPVPAGLGALLGLVLAGVTALPWSW
ncbi:hypothetical protein [Ferrovibrio terrae]|uniref:hypothetical protein n=1 Tax=Ferrovibrio terrae TaxID=2594003 RepID=UPI0031377306